MTPLCFTPIMLSSTQSRRRDFTSTIAGMCAISMRPGIRPRSLSLYAPRLKSTVIFAAVSALVSGDGLP
jgi:hypothetical protein